MELGFKLSDHLDLSPLQSALFWNPVYNFIVLKRIVRFCFNFAEKFIEYDEDASGDIGENTTQCFFISLYSQYIV